MQKLKPSNLKLPLILITVVLFLSCERKVEPTQKITIVDEVMAIHDSVMPKMGDLRKTRKAILERAETIEDSALRALLIQKGDKLDSAQKSMMGWMRQYNPTYYEDQKELIQGVKDLMESALAEGEELLEKE